MLVPCLPGAYLRNRLARQRVPTEHELVGLDQTLEPVVGDLLDLGGRVEQLREHDLERLGAVDVSAYP